MLLMTAIYTLASLLSLLLHTDSSSAFSLSFFLRFRLSNLPATMDAMCRVGMRFASSVLGYVMRVHHSRDDAGLEVQGTPSDAKAKVNRMVEILQVGNEDGSIPVLPAHFISPQCELGRGGEGVAELAKVKVFGVALCVKSCKGAAGFCSLDSSGVSAAVAVARISLLVDPTTACLSREECMEYMSSCCLGAVFSGNVKQTNYIHCLIYSYVWIAAQVDACGLSTRTDASVAQRYRKEAEVAHFEHPNIVHSIGLVKASSSLSSSSGGGRGRPVDDIVGLLTEFCSAGSLSGMLK